MKVIHCTEQNIEELAILFNDYRIFYEYESDLSASREFIRKNISENRSRIFILLDESGVPVAFTQLYRAICSLEMTHYYYLSDLYVAIPSRKSGYGRHLMNYVSDYFAKEGAYKLTLDTATTNEIAQSLYESLGYEREEVYITYHQMLANRS